MAVYFGVKALRFRIKFKENQLKLGILAAVREQLMRLSDDNIQRLVAIDRPSRFHPSLEDIIFSEESQNSPIIRR